MMSYLVTLLHERSRVRRDRAIRWDERRLDAYVTYLGAVANQAAVARRLAATAGFGHPLPEIETQAGHDLLTEGEINRSLAFQVIELIGEAGAVEAGHELNRQLWQLEWSARGINSTDAQGWDNL